MNIEYGIDIYKAAHQLQKTVKNAVETMTGLVVNRVNVSIPGIILGEHPRRASAANPSPEIRVDDGQLIGRSCLRGDR